jgi:hypothetical protein
VAAMAILSGILVDSAPGHESPWGGLVLIGAGLLIFFRYGLTREPIFFNELNLWKKPLPVWAARLIYIPMVLVILYWGVQSLVHALQ